MKTPTSFCGESWARAIWVCVPSPQSNSHHSPSLTTASALTLRCSVGLPELVPSGMIFIAEREYGKDGNNGTARKEFTGKLPSDLLFPSFPFAPQRRKEKHKGHKYTLGFSSPLLICFVLFVFCFAL